MLDTGVHSTLEDLARAKRLPPSYVSQVLRLTLLAPDIVDAILDGRQPAELQVGFAGGVSAAMGGTEESAFDAFGVELRGLLRPPCPPMLHGDATEASVGRDTNRNPS